MTAPVREPDHTCAYRAAARRLRARHGTDPVRLHRSLRALCDRLDRTRPRRTTVRRAGTAPGPLPSPAEAFADAVMHRMDGPVLRYSQRAELIRHAQHAGIGRFDANLIIAAVEHRARGVVPASKPCLGTTSRVLPALLTALSVQSLIALLAWWVIS